MRVRENIDVVNVSQQTGEQVSNHATGVLSFAQMFSREKYVSVDVKMKMSPFQRNKRIESCELWKLHFDVNSSLPETTRNKLESMRRVKPRIYEKHSRASTIDNTQIERDVLTLFTKQPEAFGKPTIVDTFVVYEFPSVNSRTAES